MSDNTVALGTVQGPLPSSKYADQSQHPMRLSAYGEPKVESMHGSKLWAVAGEGSAWVATNPTPGTGITGTVAATAVSDTHPLLYLRNNGLKTIVLDYIRLFVTAVGSNGTNFNLTVKTDSGNDRYTSGGTVITPVNPNQGVIGASGAFLAMGALTTATVTAAARLVWNTCARDVIKVLGDVYTLDFGASAHVPTGMVIDGSATVDHVYKVPAVILPPGAMMTLSDWAASQSSAAAAYELNMAWVER